MDTSLIIFKIPCNMLISSFIVYSIIAMLTQSYISLVNTQLLYCSQIWRPVLIKDIQSLEQMQRWATKFILNDFHTSDKSRLQLQGIMFFVSTLKQSALSCSSFNISQSISFSSNATRSGSHSKLVQPFVKTNWLKNFLICGMHFPQLTCN